VRFSSDTSQLDLRERTLRTGHGYKGTEGKEKGGVKRIEGKEVRGKGEVPYSFLFPLRTL